MKNEIIQKLNDLEDFLNEKCDLSIEDYQEIIKYTFGIRNDVLNMRGVVKSVKEKEIPTFQDWANRKGYYKKGTNWYNERHYQRLYENLIKMYLDEHQL